MRPRTVINILNAFALLIFAVSASALDGTAILEQVDRKMQPESYEMYRKLINIEPDGSKKEYILYTAKKDRDKMIALFLSPASETGRSTLRLGENMWLYIPNVGKPIRITSLQSVIGGVFNNSDILSLDYSVEYTVKDITEEGDRYVLELKARNATVAYDGLKMEVEKTTLLPMVIECYAASGMLIKTLRYDKIEDFGNGLVRPSVLETDSPLHKGYKSIMVYAKLQEREFKDEVFTLNYLPKVDELR